MGVLDEPNELLIRLPEGMIKVRDVMRHACPTLSWDAESLKKIKGTLRRPRMDSEDGQVYAKVKAQPEEEPITEELLCTEGVKQMRRYRIDPIVLKRIGLWSQSCPGCRAIRDGKGSSNHTEECRAIFNDHMEKQYSYEFKSSVAIPRATDVKTKRGWSISSQER